MTREGGSSPNNRFQLSTITGRKENAVPPPFGRRLNDIYLIIKDLE
jgi:hypothetical protein